MSVTVVGVSIGIVPDIVSVLRLPDIPVVALAATLPPVVTMLDLDVALLMPTAVQYHQVELFAAQEASHTAAQEAAVRQHSYLTH